MSYGSRYSCSIALQGPSSGSPSLKVTVPLFTLRGQLMLNEALLKACARSLTFCAHNPFTAPSCCFSMADDVQKGFFPWARTVDKKLS